MIDGVDAADRRLVVRWSPPPDDGGDDITGYRVRWRVHGERDHEEEGLGAASRSHRIDGLDLGTRYWAQVAAVNRVGTGPWSDVLSAVPLDVPRAPRDVAAEALDEGLRVTWQAPARDGGDPITGYKIRWGTGAGALGAAVEVDAATRVYEIGGLTNDTDYVVRVLAVNSVGDGATPRAPTLPGPPVIVAVVPLERGVTVEWQPPPDDGRAPVSSYRLSWPDGGHAEITDLGDLSHDIIGLDFGRDSVIRVSAVNSVGEGTPAAVAARSNQVPGPPRGVSITEDDGSLVVWWGPSAIAVPFAASYSGSAVTEYVVQWKTNGQDYSTDRQATVAPDSVPNDIYEAYTITGLDNGSDYSVRVIAVNEGREGPPGEASGRPRQAPPGAPPSIVVYNFEEWHRLGLWVEWEPALRDGLPADYYDLQWAPAGPGGGPFKSRRIPAWFGLYGVIDDGLEEGTAYRVRVRATNGHNGPWIETRVTVAGSPDPVPQVTATPGDGSAFLQWDPPQSDGGSPISAYLVTWGPARSTSKIGEDSSVVVTGESHEIIGLENGRTYTVRVGAINNAGTSPSWPAYQVTPDDPIDGPGVPGAPGRVVVVPGDGSLSVSWAAATDSTGAAASTYEVSWEAAGQPGTARQADAGAALSHVITGLANGTAYVVEVAAANSAGKGPATVTQAVPTGLPGAPRSVVAARSTTVLGAARILVDWLPPENDGGTGITTYQVLWRAEGEGYDDSQCSYRRADTAATVYPIGELDAGTTYHVRVVAVNASGPGPATEITVPPQNATGS